MDSPGYELFSSATFASDEHPTRLRRYGLNQLEDRAHLRALSDDVVETGQSAQFATQVACFLLPFQALGNFAHSSPQLVDQVVILDHVTVRAAVDRRDCRLHSGHSGD